MNNKILLKISLSISILGIFLLLFLSSLEPKISKISELNKTPSNSKVKIHGKILASKQLAKNFYILTIEDETGRIEIALDKNFYSNKTLEVLGKLQEYKNKTQIQAEKIIEK